MPTNRESQFQSRLKRRIEQLFPGSIVLKIDPTYIQGFPDLLVLYKDRWAALECKRNSSASHRPNQDYYVQMLDSMSYASFIFPENEETVLDELQQAFRA